ncbi:MAG: patatin-like phospholipase family protein [Segetibacter sp.]
MGLALSGGGYRAAVFHLGTLKKLREMGLLEKADVMSTISGASITGAAWCLYERNYKTFHQEMVTQLKTQSVIRYILSSWIFGDRSLLYFLWWVGNFTCHLRSGQYLLFRG